MQINYSMCLLASTRALSRAAACQWMHWSRVIQCWAKPLCISHKSAGLRQACPISRERRRLQVWPVWRQESLADARVTRDSSACMKVPRRRNLSSAEYLTLEWNITSRSRNSLTYFYLLWNRESTVGSKLTSSILSWIVVGVCEDVTSPPFTPSLCFRN